MIKKIFLVLIFLLIWFSSLISQTNSNHVKVSGYMRKDGIYVQPYFRTAPNSTNRDNFSTKGNVNPYTNKPGWIEPDDKFNTFYYNTYTYNPNTEKTINENNSALPYKYKNRTYIEDENGSYTCYLTIKDERTYNIFNLNDELIMYLVINHRGDWRLFDSKWIYIKTIFVKSEQ